MRENERCVQTKMRKREEGAEREREEGVKCCPRTVGVTQRAVAFAFVIINFKENLLLNKLFFWNFLERKIHVHKILSV